MRARITKSRLGCVPPNKYKRKEGHIWGSRRRTKDKKTGEWSEWIITCSWCGARKKESKK